MIARKHGLFALASNFVTLLGRPIYSSPDYKLFLYNAKSNRLVLSELRHKRNQRESNLGLLYDPVKNSVEKSSDHFKDTVFENFMSI